MKRLLIADDEEGVRSLVRMTLESQNYMILEASSCSETMSIAKRDHPNLILLDIMMADGSGIEVCRALKEDPSTADITVVMLTAKAEEADLDAATAAGAAGYFTKPFSPVALMARVEEILGTGIYDEYIDH
ncbi:MAG: response regulator [Actinobacteria bacterium]|nr:response regulator [Actinomycetota bacterium]